MALTRVLVEAGASTAAQADEGRMTALHVAAAMGHSDTVAAARDGLALLLRSVRITLFLNTALMARLAMGLLLALAALARPGGH